MCGTACQLGHPLAVSSFCPINGPRLQVIFGTGRWVCASGGDYPNRRVLASLNDARLRYSWATWTPDCICTGVWSNSIQSQASESKPRVQTNAWKQTSDPKFSFTFGLHLTGSYPFACGVLSKASWALLLLAFAISSASSVESPVALED